MKNLIRINNFVDSFITVVNLFLKSKLNLKKFNNSDESIIILGNGPSLKKSLNDHLNILKENKLLVVNHFAKTEYFELLKPKYYYILDPYFFDKYSVTEQTILTIKNKVDWEMKILIPYQFSKNNYFQNIVSENPNVSIFYFDYCIARGSQPFLEFLFKLNLGHVQSENVLIGAIFSCLQNNFTKIYLDGADHSWYENLKVDQQTNDLILDDQHFYPSKMRNLSMEFNDNGNRDSQLAKQMSSFYKVYKSHEILNKYALKRGVRIINISNYSTIDVYKRGAYKDLL